MGQSVARIESRSDMHVAGRSAALVQMMSETELPKRDLQSVVEELPSFCISATDRAAHAEVWRPRIDHSNTAEPPIIAFCFVKPYTRACNNRTILVLRAVRRRCCPEREWFSYTMACRQRILVSDERRSRVFLHKT